MAFNNTFTAVVGATYTASQYNTYVRDNFAAIWVGTTAGDIDYYTSATAKARVAIGGAGALLQSTGSAPAWLSIGASGYALTVSGGAPAWTPLLRYMSFLLNTDVPLTVGDNAVRFRIPAALNGWNITNVAGSRMSGTGVPAIQIRNVTDGVDILSTKLTIDSGETDSSTAVALPVINAAVDDVATADQFAIDVDVAGTNTLYFWVEIAFIKP